MSNNEVISSNSAKALSRPPLFIFRPRENGGGGGGGSLEERADDKSRGLNKTYGLMLGKWGEGGRCLKLRSSNRGLIREGWGGGGGAI